MTYPVTSPMPLNTTSITRAGTLKQDASIGSEDDFGRVKEGKADLSKDNNTDKLFIEDVRHSCLI